MHCRVGGPSHDLADHWPLWAVLRGAERSIERSTGGGQPGPRIAVAVRTNAHYCWSCHSGRRRVHRLARAAIVWRRGVPVLFAYRAVCGTLSCLAQWGDAPPDGLRPCGICDAILANRAAA